MDAQRRAGDEFERVFGGFGIGRQAHRVAVGGVGILGAGRGRVAGLHKDQKIARGKGQRLIRVA